MEAKQQEEARAALMTLSMLTAAVGAAMGGEEGGANLNKLVDQLTRAAEGPNSSDP